MIVRKKRDCPPRFKSIENLRNLRNLRLFNSNQLLGIKLLAEFDVEFLITAFGLDFDGEIEGFHVAH